MKAKYTPVQTLRMRPTHYCPGCGHGLVHRIVAEVIDELGLRDRTVGIAPVGCAVIAYDYWDFDVSEAAHGRALAVATGIKRVHPGLVVFTYQGDGDLAAIGLTETVHAANRGEDITCVFVNNAVYGMTGGQMAPTTLLEQKTATTPQGRSSARKEGFPLHITEMLGSLRGVVYAQRCAVDTPPAVMDTKKALRRAFETQLRKEGFSIVEVLSACPTILGKSPQDAHKWVNEKLRGEFPLGRIK